jgi:fucose permease
MTLSAVAAVTCSAAFVAGMLVVLLDSLKGILADRFKISEVRAGNILPFCNLALILLLPVSGVLVDLLGVRPVLIGGSLLLAGALCSLTLCRNYTAALGWILLAATGTVCLNVASVVLMPIAFGFGQVELLASLNLGFIFLTLGALMTPTLADVLLRTLDFRRALAILALICLVPAVIAAVSSADPAREARVFMGQRFDPAAVLSNVIIWLMAVAFMCYATVEFLVSTWGTTYLIVDQGYRESRAVWLMFGFWLAFLASRFLLILGVRQGILGQQGAAVLIFILAIVPALLLGYLGDAARPRSSAWALLLFGFVVGPIYPTLAALLLESFPNQQGTAYGIACSASFVGSGVLTLLLAMLARRRSILTALRLLIVLVVVMALTVLAVWLTPPS